MSTPGHCEPNDAGRVSKRDELCTQYGAEMIHPSQDYRVIAGQGTIGLELDQQLDSVDCVVVPGLSGLALFRGFCCRL